MTGSSIRTDWLVEAMTKALAADGRLRIELKTSYGVPYFVVRAGPVGEEGIGVDIDVELVAQAPENILAEIVDDLLAELEEAKA